MTLHWIDWLIVIAYLAFGISVGLLMRRRASQNMEEYFLSGRTLPWWLAGTSMVATSFASDTPLVVSGWVRDYGIWKNWLWWCYAISGLLGTFLFARWWRRANVMTKAELTELRYGGAGGQALRFFLGAIHAFVTNTMVLCWVLLAAAKIMNVLFGIDQWISVSIACGLAMFYSLLAGFWGVVLTDLLQFTISIIGAVTLAVFCWQAVDGIEGVRECLASSNLNDSLLNFLPPTGGGSPWQPEFWTVPVAAVAVYLGIGWWAVEDADGGTVAVQRISASRDDHQGMLAILWYNIVHFAFRPWPWFLVALASLVILPTQEIVAPVDGIVTNISAAKVTVESADGNSVTASAQAAHDRGIPGPDWQPAPLVEPGAKVIADQVVARTDSEQAYVVMLQRYLPVGLLGLVVASLLAAFMSTIDTHVNLAASFFMNDIYRRFFKQDADARHYVHVARIASITIMVVAGILAAQASSIARLFEFFLAFLAGVGPVYIMRWLWWRVTATTEIVALVTSCLAATSITVMTDANVAWPLGALAPDGNLEPAGRTVLVLCFSLSAVLISLLIAPKPDPASLVPFYRSVRPNGWWGPVAALAPDVQSPGTLFIPLVGAAGGMAMVFGALVSMGCWLLDKPGLYTASFVSAVGGGLVFTALRRIRHEESIRN